MYKPGVLCGTTFRDSSATMTTRSRRVPEQRPQGSNLAPSSNVPPRKDEEGGTLNTILMPCLCLIVVVGYVAITGYNAIAAVSSPVSQVPGPTAASPHSMRGSGNPVAPHVGPDPQMRKVIPLPYGTDLQYTDQQVMFAVQVGLAGVRPEMPADAQADWVPGFYDVPREYYQATAVSLTKVEGGGVINTVYDVLLSNGKHVFVKLGSPFWRGCAKSVSEAAVQEYVRTRTSIPVPRVLAAQPARYVRRDGSRTPIRDIVRADADGVASECVLPDFVIIERAPGRKLQHELARTDLPKATRTAYMEAWVDVFHQLRSLKFPSYGSFQQARPAKTDPPTDVRLTVGPLTTNGGCSGLGPFRTYPEYAAARVRALLLALGCAGSIMSGKAARVTSPNAVRRWPCSCRLWTTTCATTIGSGLSPHA